MQKLGSGVDLLMMKLGSADLVFLCFVCFWRELTATVFALDESQFRFCLGCVAPCLEDSLLAELRLEEV